MEKQQILLIHGGNIHASDEAYREALRAATPILERIQSRRDWKNELQDDLGDNYIVYMPSMPNKQNAKYDEWRIVFEKALTLLDDNCILIGYSLGAIFLVKYLSENSVSKKIKQTHLLGGPFNNDGMEKEPLHSFLREGDLSSFENQAGNMFFYHSEDDFAVPFDHIEKYERALPQAHLRKFKDRNHFFQAHIPELVNDILDD